MKFYIIAGEASGDLHASNLVKQLKLLDASAELRGWGGDLMKGQGVSLVKHYRELAFMGFIEVVVNLKTILANIEFCKNDILKFEPDALILVDYPGFNLRIAKFASDIGLKVFYYISPQVWAWKQSRVHSIKKNVDSMFVILPFEKDFYKKFDFDVTYVGHPLLDVIEEGKTEPAFKTQWLLKNNFSDTPVIALLPGSRRQEITTMLPVMLDIRNDFKDYQFIIGAAPSVQEEFYKKLIGAADAKIVFSQSYELLQVAEAALVTSGTATLETALFEVPEVVCYKGNVFSYHIAKQLVKVKYIALVNLILDKPAVKELIQSDFTKENLGAELNKLLHDPAYRNEMSENFKELKKLLGGKGASEKTARGIYEYLNRG
ncbi:MAG: lipid-A-disaccharide synthase [Bacteroidia bacterium]